MPTAAMTANVRKEEVERCQEAGVDGHVPMPFKPGVLLKAIGLAIRAGQR